MRREQKASHDLAMQARGRLPERVSGDELSLLNEALRHMFTDLRYASTLFHEPGDNGRAGAIAALSATVQFVQLFGQPLAENLEVPLLRLQAALTSLYENNVEPMVSPMRRVGRAKFSDARAALMGHVAGTVRRLTQTGLDDGSARRSVADHLHKLGVRAARGHGDITERTIRGWCEKVAEDVGRHGTAATVRDSMLAPEEERRFAKLSLDRARAFALESLTTFVSVNFPECAEPGGKARPER